MTIIAKYNSEVGNFYPFRLLFIVYWTLIINTTDGFIRVPTIHREDSPHQLT